MTTESSRPSREPRPTWGFDNVFVFSYAMHIGIPAVAANIWTKYRRISRVIAAESDMQSKGTPW